MKLGKRAISPLIATIILISICVAGGLLIYSVFFSSAGTLTAKGQVSVESMDLVKDTTGNVVFSITVKNTGNKPATTINVKLTSESEVDILDEAGMSSLEPGQSVSYVKTGLSGYTSGNSYNVVIKATFSDGSSFTTTTSVKCRSGGISPLIATIILISICVAGGLLIYSVFFSTSGTLTAKGELTVEAIDLVKDTDGNIVFTITIKNSGNKPIHSTDANRLVITLGTGDTIKLAGGTKKSGGNMPDAKNLQPGQSISVDLYYSDDGKSNDDISGTYVVGNSYNVVIQAKFSDGSTFTTTTSVKCRSA